MTLPAMFLSVLVLVWCCSQGQALPQVPVEVGLSPKSPTSMQENSRSVLLNPFNIFGNPLCEYKGVSGTCYGEVECLALAGRFGNFCSGLRGLCCLFYRTCGQRTSQKVSYFKNVQYPLSDPAQEFCSFQVVRHSNDYCGLKVEMEDANLPTRKFGQCTDISYQVTGIHSNRLEPKCGLLTGDKYIYDFRVPDLMIHVNASQPASAMWSMKVTQIPCSEYSDEDATGISGGSVDIGTVGGSGGGTGGGAGSVPDSYNNFLDHKAAFDVASRHAILSEPARIDGGWLLRWISDFLFNIFPPLLQKPPIIPLPIVPPASEFVCGIKGPSFNQGSRNPSSPRRLEFLDALEPESSRRKGGHRRPVDSTRKREHDGHRPNRRRPGFSNNSPLEDQLSERQNAAVNSSEVNSSGTGVINTRAWGGPDLSDTLFAHYAGDRSIFSNRITYGQVAGLHEFPWLVAMTINGRFHCGASLIGDYWILTAAHCVNSYTSNPSAISLSLGDWDLSTENDGPSVSAKISKITVHPSYSRSTLQNDLAVAKLSSKINYSEDIKPICLPSNNNDLEGMQAVVSGWGRNEDGKLQSQLHHLHANIVSNKVCDERWNAKGSPTGFIVSSMMCMDSTNGDSCNGDSGGPSIMEEPAGSGIYVQVGLVSFGSGSCTDEKLPGVYTRVGHYVDWIKAQMV
nr:protein masquerade-like isoform X1 [Cherax quadricarinatus]